MTSDPREPAEVFDKYAWDLSIAASTLGNRELRALEVVLAARMRDVAGLLYQPGWSSSVAGVGVRYRDLLRNMNGCLDAFADAELLRRGHAYVRQERPWQKLRVTVDLADPFARPIRTADLLLRERRNVIAEHRRPDEMSLPVGDGSELRVVSIRHYSMEGGRATEDEAIVQLAVALGVTPPTSAEMAHQDSSYYEQWLHRAEAQAIEASHPSYETVRKALTRAHRDAPLAGPTVGYSATMVLQLVGMHLRAISEDSR